VSIPLKDFRVGITESIAAALEARAEATGRDMQSVARDVLLEWARREHHAYTVYARRVIANGSQLELPGVEMEDDGTRRKGRR
jgi:hypothetical protein